MFVEMPPTLGVGDPAPVARGATNVTGATNAFGAGNWHLAHTEPQALATKRIKQTRPEFQLQFTENNRTEMKVTGGPVHIV